MAKRNRYSDEYIAWLIKNAPSSTFNQLYDKTRSKWHYEVSRDGLRKLCSRRKIRYVDYDYMKAQAGGTKPGRPAGSEWVRNDGMVLVKTEDGRWMYKQRYIYEQYYNVKLPKSIMVIFLDGNRQNFDIKNLRAVTTPTYNTAKNKHLISEIPEVTDAALDLAELYQVVTRKENEDEKII